MKVVWFINKYIAIVNHDHIIILKNGDGEIKCWGMEMDNLYIWIQSQVWKNYFGLKTISFKTNITTYTIKIHWFEDLKLSHKNITTEFVETEQSNYKYIQIMTTINIYR